MAPIPRVLQQLAALLQRLVRYLFLGLVLRLGGSPQHIAFIMDGNRRFAANRSINKLSGHSLGYSKASGGQAHAQDTRAPSILGPGSTLTPVCSQPSGHCPLLQMVDVIHWCLALGVPCISVYAFSIDNFARSLDEVQALMHLAELKYEELTKVRTCWHGSPPGRNASCRPRGPRPRAREPAAVTPSERTHARACVPQEDGLAEAHGVEIRVVGDLSLAPPAVQGSAARLMLKTQALPAKRAVLNICFSYQ